MPDLTSTRATPFDFELGRTALLEITSAESIGGPVDSVDEGDGTVTVYFDSLLTGYPGWRWTVSIAHAPDSAPNVLETELTPGENALLSPAWVPWEARLADTLAAQDAEALAGDDDESGDDESDDDESGDDESDDDESDDDDDLDDDGLDDDESDDDDDLDDDDDDDFGSDVLHSGDVDGVDIDESDDADDDDDDNDDRLNNGR